ncbi:MAG: hypothetical protein ACREQY_03865 [Candidatus Binatia bacterium]
MKRKRRPSIDEIMEDGILVDDALRRAAREALLRHKRAGVPIAVWRNGKVVEIPAAQIKVPAEPSSRSIRRVRGRVSAEVSKRR